MDSSYKHIKAFGAFCLISLVGLLGQSWADTVRLRFSLFTHHGRILQVTPQTVLFQPDKGKPISWPRSHVVNLTFEDPPVPTGYPPPAVLPQNAPATVPPKAAVLPAEIDLPPGSQLDGIARFKTAQTQYLGLYQWDARPSCWLILPNPLSKPQTLTFDGVPKWNPAQAPKAYQLSVRFLDDRGQLLQQPIPVIVPAANGLVAWFIYLDGMSGVGNPTPVRLTMPPRTKTIEWAVLPNDSIRQLVGYISQIRLPETP